jgi:hypothetical protein
MEISQVVVQREIVVIKTLLLILMTVLHNVKNLMAVRVLNGILLENIVS